MSYREYEDPNFGEVRRKSMKREIDEALDEELDALNEIDFYSNVDDVKKFM